MVPPPCGAVLFCGLSQSLNCMRWALKPGVFALAMLSAITSMARCWATRREVATLEAMSMGAIRRGFDDEGARGMPPALSVTHGRKTAATTHFRRVAVPACDVTLRCEGGTDCRTRPNLPGGLFKTPLRCPRRDLEVSTACTSMRRTRHTLGYRRFGGSPFAPCPR